MKKIWKEINIYKIKINFYILDFTLIKINLQTELERNKIFKLLSKNKYKINFKVKKLMQMLFIIII